MNIAIFVSIIIGTLSLLPINGNAGCEIAKTFKSDKSECRVEVSCDEYADYTVLKGKKVIFTKLETASAVVFSTDGKYIAIGDTNISPITVNNINYHIVVINCQTEKAKGYLKIFEDTKVDRDGWRYTIESASPLYFEQGNSILKYEVSRVISKNDDKSKYEKRISKLIFDKNNPLP
jgi:hypothetical protein